MKQRLSVMFAWTCSDTAEEIMSTETHSASLSLCDRLSGRPEIIPLSVSALEHSLVKGRVCKRARYRRGAEAQSTLWIIVLRAFSPLRKQPTLYPFPSFFYTFRLNVFPLLVFLPALTEECWEVRETLGHRSITVLIKCNNNISQGLGFSLYDTLLLYS